MMTRTMKVLDDVVEGDRYHRFEVDDEAVKELRRCKEIAVEEVDDDPRG